MLVRFTTTENNDNTSPLILTASKRLAGHIRASLLNSLENSNIRMVFAKEIERGQFEFVYAFGDFFSIEEIMIEIDFPELLDIEAHELSDTARPSMIANVGRIVDASSSTAADEDDDAPRLPLERDEEIPF